MENDEQTHCPTCGWNWGKNPEDGRPLDYECFCWEDAYARAEWRSYLQLLEEDLPITDNEVLF